MCVPVGGDAGGRVFAPDAAHIELTITTASSEIASNVRGQIRSGQAAEDLRALLAASIYFQPDVQVDLTLIGVYESDVGVGSDTRNGSDTSSVRAPAALDYAFPDTEPMTEEASTSVGVAIGAVVAATVTTSVASSVAASTSASALGAASAGGGGRAFGSAIGQVQFVSLTSHIKANFPTQYNEITEGMGWLNMRFDTPGSPSESNIGVRPGDAIPIMRRRIFAADESEGEWSCSARNDSVQGMATCGLWRQLYGAAIFMGVIICIHGTCLLGHTYCTMPPDEENKYEDEALSGRQDGGDDAEISGNTHASSQNKGAVLQQGLLISTAGANDAASIKMKYGRKLGKKLGLAAKAGGATGFCGAIATCCLSVPILSDLLTFLMNGGLEDALLFPNPELMAFLFLLPGVSEAAGGAVATLSGAGFALGIAMTVLVAIVLLVVVT